MVIKQIISAAEHPVEDMCGTSDDPCLLVRINNTELVVQLFRHTILTMRKRDFKFSADVISSFIKQRMMDQRVCKCFFNYICWYTYFFIKLALVLKETSALNITMEDNLMRQLMWECGEIGHLHCCFELLRIHPVPVLHPIMNVLKVMGKFSHKISCSKNFFGAGKG